jgi:hypothetical protein
MKYTGTAKSLGSSRSKLGAASSSRWVSLTAAACNAGHTSHAQAQQQRPLASQTCPASIIGWAKFADAKAASEAMGSCKTPRVR